MIKSIVVYCGSNSGSNAIYSDAAFSLGKEMAKRNISLIYGGGNMGLMGKVSDGALINNGHVTGIITNFLAKLEVAQKEVSELHFVETMHERKAKMVAASDGVIALPGGYGTLDELFEILTWSQLNIFKGPIGILNINGYYDFLILQIDKMVEEGFLRPDNRDLVIIDVDIKTLLDKIENFEIDKNKALDHTLYVETNNISKPTS